MSSRPLVTSTTTFPTNFSPVTGDPAALADQIAKSIQGEDRANQAEYQQIMAAIQSGKVTPDWDVQGRCKKAGKQPGTGALLERSAITSGASIGGSIGLGGIGSFAGLGLTGAALGAATAGIGAVVGIGLMLLQHHSQAVIREDATLCQFVPQINSSIAQIDAAVQAGKMTAAQASSAFAQLYTLAKQAFASIMKPCNAECLILGRLKAIGMYRCTLYSRAEQAAAAAASSGSGSILGGASGGSTPGLGTVAAIIGGGALLAH